MLGNQFKSPKLRFLTFYYFFIFIKILSYEFQGSAIALSAEILPALLSCELEKCRAYMKLNNEAF